MCVYILWIGFVAIKVMYDRILSFILLKYTVDVVCGQTMYRMCHNHNNNNNIIIVNHRWRI